MLRNLGILWRNYSVGTNNTFEKVKSLLKESYSKKIKPIKHKKDCQCKGCKK